MCADYWCLNILFMKKKKFYVVECSKDGKSTIFHVNYEVVPEFVKEKESLGFQVSIYTEVYVGVDSENYVFPSYFILDYNE